MDRLEHMEGLRHLMSTEEAARAADTSTYEYLAMRARDTRSICRKLLSNPQRGDEDDIDALMLEEITHHHLLFVAGRISAEQKRHLFELMTLDNPPPLRENAVDMGS